MAQTLKPETEDQVADAIAWAVSEEIPLELLAGATKRGFGRPLQTAHTLDLSSLAGITLYEPEELVLSAGPGTKLAELESVLADQDQQLAFEPADLGPLLGGAPGPRAIICWVCARSAAVASRSKPVAG